MLGASLERPWVGALVGCALMLVVAVADYFTGPAVTMGILYYGGIGVAAWYVGERVGVGVAVASALCWWLIDRWTAPATPGLVVLWNVGLRVVAFSGFARLISHLCDMQVRLRATVQQLEHTLHEVKTLQGLLPICANCKKIRDDHGYWQQVETYLTERTNVTFTHGICPDCMQRLYGEFA
jgi:hypothetical protein